MDSQELSVNGFVDEVVQATKGWHPRKFCFVLGAGASRTSGIKSGQELVDIWDKELRERNESDYFQWRQEQGITDTNKYSFYSQYYEKRFKRTPSDGRNMLEGLMSSAKPSAGYAMLAYILTRPSQYLNVVITTNFDHLIEDAVHDYEHHIPLVVGHAALAHYVTSPFHRPTVIKIHHDLLFDPKNTTKEVSALAKEWEKALDAVFREYHPVFIGYAGNDASLMSFLNQNSKYFASGEWKFPYWLLYKTDTLSKDAENFIHTSGGYLIKHDGFDETLCLLSVALNYELPPKKKFALEAEERYRNLSRSFDMLSQSMSSKANETTSGKSVQRTVEDTSELSQAIDRVAERAELQRLFKDAVILDNEKKFDKALEIERKLVRRDPKNALYHYRYGSTLSNVERFDDAIRELKKAVSLEPDDASYHCELGLAFSEAGHAEDAITAMQKAIELDPGEAFFKTCLGDMLLDLDRSADAIPVLQDAIALNSDDAYPRMSIARAFCDIGHYDEALAEIDSAIQIDPHDSYLHFLRGQILDGKEQFEDAVKEYQKAVDLDPDDPLNYLELGQALWVVGDFEGACAEIKQAIAMAPDDALYHHELGYILYEESKDPLDLALTPDELNFESLMDASVFTNSTESMQKCPDNCNEKEEDEPPFDMELMAQAIEELRKAADLAPENAIYQYDLGDALWDAGEVVAASMQVKKALALDSSNDQYKTTLSRIEAEIKHEEKSGTPT